MSEKVFKSQMELFRYLWDNYPRVDVLTNERIEVFSHWNYHHILGKQSHPRLKLDIQNIAIVTPETHVAIHQHGVINHFENAYPVAVAKYMLRIDMLKRKDSESYKIKSFIK